MALLAGCLAAFATVANAATTVLKYGESNRLFVGFKPLNGGDAIEDSLIVSHPYEVSLKLADGQPSISSVDGGLYSNVGFSPQRSIAYQGPKDQCIRRTTVSNFKVGTKPPVIYLKTNAGIVFSRDKFRKVALGSTPETRHWMFDVFVHKPYDPVLAVVETEKITCCSRKDFVLGARLVLTLKENDVGKLDCKASRGGFGFFTNVAITLRKIGANLPRSVSKRFRWQVQPTGLEDVRVSLPSTSEFEVAAVRVTLLEETLPCYNSITRGKKVAASMAEEAKLPVGSLSAEDFKKAYVPQSKAEN